MIFFLSHCLPLLSLLALKAKVNSAFTRKAARVLALYSVVNRHVLRFTEPDQKMLN